ncbi:hypothetical protein PZ897_06145 [Hoeflea sp. YIM 152468]|uniref:hypothetical protein n=1 Tax=Hoeflea sp. YIM 152468 TaxID=3031759 RepID=UPI0023DA13C5|nr:hypothetical protein [Hoeflea sp. YIM 152468]MDF1607752.1 hypothetical protein [Hoeflea sp. YIM 152468]
MGDRCKRRFRTGDRIVASALALTGLLPLPQASALSELKPVETPASDVEQGPALPPLEGPLLGTDGGLPAPDPMIRTTPDSADETTSPDLLDSQAAGAVEILTDPAQLPEPAQRMRELILAAAATGDLEKLRPLLGTGPGATQLAFAELDADAVDYLRSTSGDGEGHEILAILIDLLNTGFVRIDAGKPTETYVWPYFAALPLAGLSPPQKVELLRLVTAGDVEDMKAYGAYNFFRVGISPEGDWRFFMAGD